MAYYYVDPVSGSDTTGDGLSDGNAWQTLQHALDNITKDTYGDQINLKSSGANVLTADLSFSTYFPTTSTTGLDQLVIRGYGSVANDGGVGVISGDDSFQITALNDTSLIDLEIRNTDPAVDGIASLNNYSRLINCYLHTINRDAIGSTLGRTQIIGCRFENISRTACRSMTGYMHNCYFANGADYAFTNALNLSAQGHVVNCIFDLSGGSNGVDCTSLGNAVNNCTFYGRGSGFGTAYLNGGSEARGSSFTENIIAGFSSGKGVDIQSNANLLMTNNSFHDVGTPITDPATGGTDAYTANSGNETLASGDNPLAESGARTFDNRMTYFAPLNVGSVLSGALPRGAAPSPGSTGGGSSYSLHPLAYN